MSTYVFILRGEDHTEFAWDTEADSRDLAYDKLECVYPEATVIECKDDMQRRDSQERLERYVASQYDNDWYYDDDRDY